MKKIIGCLLVLAIICSCFTGGVVTSYAAKELSATGSCGENAAYTYDVTSALLTISGRGNVENYSFQNQVGIKTVVIENGITSIGAYAFSGCTALTRVVIAQSVTSIGYNAFENCDGLKTAGPEGSGCNIEFGWKTGIFPEEALKQFSAMKVLVVPEGIEALDNIGFPEKLFIPKELAMRCLNKEWMIYTLVKSVYYYDNISEIDWNSGNITSVYKVYISGLADFSGNTDYLAELGKYTNAEQFWQTVARSIFFFEKTIDISSFEIPATEECFDNMLACFCGQISYFEEYTDSLYVSKVREGKIAEISVKYGKSNQIELESEEAKSIAHSLIADLENNDNVSDEIKALIVHDRLIDLIDYDMGFTHYSAEEAFLYKRATCSGFSEAYKYLMNRLGIPCEFVLSDGLNHSWNMVLIDGEPYYVDCTWDDPVCAGSGEGGLGGIHDFCLCSEEGFGHSDADDWRSPFPVNSTKYDNTFWKNTVGAYLLCVSNKLLTDYCYSGLAQLDTLTSKPKLINKRSVDSLMYSYGDSVYYYSKGKIYQEKTRENGANIINEYSMGYIIRYIAKSNTTMIVSGIKVYEDENVELSFKNGNLICSFETIDVVPKKRKVTIKDFKKRGFNSLLNAKVTGIKDKTYSGKPVTQSFTVSINGKTLKKGRDYTVKYSSNKNIGKVVVTISGKGAYKDTIKKSFSILPKGTVMTKTRSEKKAFSVQWKQNKNVKGYQIQYSLKSDFSGAKTVTIKSNKTLKTTIKKLSAKKVYYVRIRTWKTVAKVNYFSSWSKAVKVKTK